MKSNLYECNNKEVENFYGMGLIWAIFPKLRGVTFPLNIKERHSPVHNASFDIFGAKFVGLFTPKSVLKVS